MAHDSDTPRPDRPEADPVSWPGDGEWEPFASFVVEFQVRVIDQEVETITSAHHVEADVTRSWNFISAPLAATWMGERARRALDVRISGREQGRRHPTDRR